MTLDYELGGIPLKIEGAAPQPVSAVSRDRSGRREWVIRIEVERHFT
jgi:hypothetical protein